MFKYIETPSTQHKSVVFSYNNNDNNKQLIYISVVNTHSYSVNKIKNLINTASKNLINLGLQADTFNTDIDDSKLEHYVVAKFFNEDEAYMFESFCIRKFSPLLNISGTFVDDKVFIKNKHFVGDEAEYDINYKHINPNYKHVDINHVMTLCCLLIDLDYPIKLVQDVTGVSKEEIESMLYRYAEYSSMILPYEYISADNRILVDKNLLRHFTKLFKDVVEHCDMKYSVLSDY